MFNEINGTQNGVGLKIGIVVSRFNEFITKQLLDGALQTLTSAGVKDSDITVTWVPGAFELPVVSKSLAENTDVNAVICLGAVIKGETDHYDMVAGNAASGILTTSLTTTKPIVRRRNNIENTPKITSSVKPSPLEGPTGTFVATAGDFGTALS